MLAKRYLESDYEAQQFDNDLQCFMHAVSAA